MIIGITGKIGSGKDTAQDFFVKKHKFKAVYSGAFIRALARKKHIKVSSRSVLWKLQHYYRQRYGQTYFAKLVIEHIKQKGWKNVVIGGIRPPEEALLLKKELKMIFLEVVADPEIRFQRIKNRGRKGDPKTFAEFRKMDETEIKKFRYALTQKHVDYAIENNRGKPELERKLQKLSKKLGIF